MYSKEKKTKICIFYHVPQRELNSCLIIAKAIKKINPDAEVIVKEFYEGICPAILYRPDVILTIPPRDVNTSNRLMIVKKLVDCSVLSLLTEGFYQSFQEHRIQIAVGTNKYSPKMIDMYLFWGEKTRKCFVDILKKGGKIVDEVRSQTVGYTYYDVDAVKDFFKGKELPDEVLRWKQNFKKRILVLTGFHIAEFTKSEQITMSAFRYYSVKGKEKEYEQEIQEWQEKKEKFLDYREKYLDCIVKFAKKHPDVGVLIKLHPVELESFSIGKKFQYYCRLEKYDNIILLKESVLLGRILPYVDAMIHYGSTSGLEAYIYDVPTVQLYDSKYDERLGEPGVCIYESTVKIDVNEHVLFDKILYTGIEPRYLETVEEFLKDQFNWTKDKKDQYHPAETYAKIILDSVGKGQKIDDDAFYNAALHSDMGYDIKFYFVKEMIRMMIKGKRKESIKCQKILKKLDVPISVLGCATVGFRVIHDKVERKIFKKFPVQ